MSAAIGFEDWQALVQLYADYAHVVDAGLWEQWPEFFTEDCVYRVQPRENHGRGFPPRRARCSLSLPLQLQLGM